MALVSPRYCYQSRLTCLSTDSVRRSGSFSSRVGKGTKVVKRNHRSGLPVYELDFMGFRGKAPMFVIIRSIILLLGITASFPEVVLGDSFRESPRQVWQVGDQRWTIEAEQGYARWIEESVTEDFFLKYRIPIDCADVPYALRWIYARIAHLPAAATRWDGSLFGHWTTTWGALPTHREWHKDRRFLAALRSLIAETSTHTLPADTYPIRIDRESIQPGTLFFMAESHAGVVNSLVLDGSTVHPVQVWEATLPPKIRKMSPRNFFASEPKASFNSGLVRFRWPVFEDDRWTYRPAQEHPFFSEEQYDFGFMRANESFDEAVARKIDPTPHDPREKAELLVHSLYRRLKERIPLVHEGYQRCHKGGCPEDSSSWEVYSTPGRDGMIMIIVDHLQKLLAKLKDKEDILREMKALDLPISHDRNITLYDVFLNYQWLSPHPGDSVELRWGLKKCEMIHERLEEFERSMAFIEKKYRLTDPSYADFAQQLKFRKFLDLRQEGEQAECSDLPFLTRSGDTSPLDE